MLLEVCVGFRTITFSSTFMHSRAYTDAHTERQNLVKVFAFSSIKFAYF